MPSCSVGIGKKAVPMLLFSLYMRLLILLDALRPTCVFLEIAQKGSFTEGQTIQILNTSTGTNYKSQSRYLTMGNIQISLPH